MSLMMCIRTWSSGGLHAADDVDRSSGGLHVADVHKDRVQRWTACR